MSTLEPGSIPVPNPAPDPMLTADELALVDMLGKCSNLFGKVVGSGRTRSADLTEVVHHIHVLQQAVLSQAAARAYPDQFRLLGEAFDK